MKLERKQELVYDFILPCIASAIGISVFFVPHDWYAFKAVGLIIYNLIIWRKQIKDLLFRRKKKN